MPTLRAADAPISLRLDVGQALTVTAATGSSARVFDPLDNSPDSIVSGATSTFGPYSVPQNLQIRCSSGAVSFSVSGTGASGLSLAQEAAVASLASVSGAGNVTVSASRAVTAADNGGTLICTTAVTLTIPAGLSPMPSFSVVPPATGVATIAVSGGATTNGATTALDRGRTINPAGFVVTAYPETDAYGVSGG